MSAHEIDYAIMGEEIQCVEVQLDPGESVIAEAGSFMMMDQEITMETIFGDGSGGSRGSGLMGKLMGAGKRLLTGESLFMTVFTHSGSYGRKSVTFAAPYPGKIIPLDLQQYGGKIICQKDSFLCAAKGVSIGIEFQRKLGTGFLVVKVLLCKSWRVTDFHLYTLAVMLWNAHFNRERRLSWTLAV